MNAHATIEADIDRSVANEVADELDKALKATEFKPSHEAELELFDNTMRAGIAKREQRIADRKKATKAKVADIEAEIARLKALVVEAKAESARANAADTIMVKKAKAALAIGGE